MLQSRLFPPSLFCYFGVEAVEIGDACFFVWRIDSNLVCLRSKMASNQMLQQMVVDLANDIDQHHWDGNTDDSGEVSTEVIDHLVAGYAHDRDYKDWMLDQSNQLHSVTMKTLPAETWMVELAKSTFHSNRNLTTLGLSGEEFAIQANRSYQMFYNFVLALRNHPIDQAALTGTSHRYSDELYYICFPLFVNVFLHLFETGYYNSSRELFNSHARKFVRNSSQLPILNAMRETLIENVLNNGLQGVKTSRFRILITQSSMDLLTTFLIKANLQSLLHIMNTNLDFRIVDHNLFDTNKIKRQASNQNATILPNPQQSNNSTITNNNGSNAKTPWTVESLQRELNRLKEAVNEETQAKVDKTSVNVCNFHLNVASSISCTNMSNDLSKVVAATEASAILLWDFELASEMAYYSSRALKHWKRLPVKRSISTVDFDCLVYKQLEDKAAAGGKDDDETSGMDELSSKLEPIRLLGHSSSVYEMSFASPSLLLSCSGDKSVRAWDLNSSACVATYHGHKSTVWSLHVAGQAKSSFASASSDGTALFWDMERSVPVRVFHGHEADVNRVRFHPNGNYLATASEDRTIVLWDLNLGRQVRKLVGHFAAVNSIAFSPCGRYLYSGGDDCALQVWDIGEGRCVNRTDQHPQDMIREVCVSPSGDRISVISCYKSEAFLWRRAQLLREAKAGEDNPEDLVQHVQLGAGLVDEKTRPTLALAAPALIGQRFLNDNLLMIFSKNRE